MTILGTIALWLTALVGLWALLVGILGQRWHRPPLVESSRRAGIVVAPVLLVALLSLVAALVRRDLNLAYVSDHVSRNLSTGFTIAAVLAGWNGFVLVTAGAFALLAFPLFGRRTASFPPIAVLSLLIVVATTVVIAAGNPFQRLGVTPVDGRGLDPLLQGPVLILERPLSIFGYAALGMAMLVKAGRGEKVRITLLLRISWLLLTLSLAVSWWQLSRFVAPAGETPWTAFRIAAALVWLDLSIALVVQSVRAGGKIVNWITAPGPVALLAATACLVAAAIGSRGGSSRQVRLKAGGSISVPSSFHGSYTLTHMGVSRFQMADRVTAAATLDAVRNERPVGLIGSEKRQYFGLLGQPIEGPITTVGTHRGLLEDVRVVFQEGSSTEEALYQISIVPLASLIWLGAALLVLGGLLLIVGAGK